MASPPAAQQDVQECAEWDSAEHADEGKEGGAGAGFAHAVPFVRREGEDVCAECGGVGGVGDAPI